MIDRRTWTFIGVGLAVALLVGVVVSQFASGNPDGLEYVAEQEGFIDTAEDHTFGDTALADYGAGLTGNDRLNTAIAGFLGTLVTLLLGWGVFALARRSGRRPAAP